jgi:hypothetical protein
MARHSPLSLWDLGAFLMLKAGWMLAGPGWEAALACWLAGLVAAMALLRWSRRLLEMRLPSGSAGFLPLRGRWLGYGLAIVAVCGLAPVLGATIGGYAYSAFTEGMYAWLEPSTISQGQYGMIFMLTLPIGALFGLGLAMSLASWFVGKPAFGAACGLLVGGVLLAGLLDLSEQRTMWELFDEVTTLPGLGAPLIWAVALLAFSLFLAGRAYRDRRRATLGGAHAAAQA